MEALCHSEDMLTKATQLWTMLDDMAESSPESYRQFMQQQLMDAKGYYAPPEPELCLEAHILDPTEKQLFVNLCRWNKVPAPKSPSDPVPVCSSKMEDISNKSGAYSILAIAYNPSILEKGKENPAVRDQLIRLSLKYIEEHFSVVLSPSYSIEKFKLKGSLERVRQSLRGGQAPVPLSKQSTRQVTPSMKDSSLKDLMLNQLRNITAKEDSSDLSLLRENITPSKTRLIEEISSTTTPEKSCTPVYTLTTRKDEHGKPLNVELKVELPEIRCISKCSLSVSKDDVLIECPEKYRLHLNLPQAVNEEATAATFYKRKGVLLITMPILQ